MRILVDPSAVSYDGMYGNRHGSLASIGYDFSANYMGFFWASGTRATVEGGPLSIDGRTSSYGPERYSPAGGSFLTPTSPEVETDAWKNIGVNAQIDILTSGPANKPQGDYRLSFGASLRQSLLDNLHSESMGTSVSPIRRSGSSLSWAESRQSWSSDRTSFPPLISSSMLESATASEREIKENEKENRIRRASGRDTCDAGIVLVYRR